MGGEIELRARVAELELELASRDDADRDAEIEELRAAVSMYKAENRKLQGTPGAVRGGRRTTSRTHSNNTEAAHLQSQIDDMHRANNHLQQSISYKEKQLTSATAAAAWAHSQLASVVQRLQGLSSEVDLASGTRNIRRRSPSPGSRQQSLSQNGEGLKTTLGDLSTLITTSDQAVQSLERKLQALDIEGRVKDLETQLSKWRTSAERQRGEVEMLETENRELRERLQNGGALLQKDDGPTRIISPEVIRMPSHAQHSVNSEHWPVRSVAAQTPRTDDLAAWGISEGGLSPRIYTPRSYGRSLTSQAWDAPSAPGYATGATPPVSPGTWQSPSRNTTQSHESPRLRRASSPASRSSKSGLVSSAVLRRHLGTNSPFHRGTTYS
eukprot:TRINITY_DN20237_c0_g1_i1.p2 TRINITY_DN20237_c0_g1~~TRINITY_DN20237_c0_g1_i1.p2  ORF type:complete len:383 (+),score=123.61 TRINITY_DN20237_c0_g1_i1:156-1304(+)